MEFKQILKNLSRGLWEAELDRLDTLRAEEQQYLTTIVYNEELEKELKQIESLLNSTVTELDEYKYLAINTKRPSYNNWIIHEPEYTNTDGLKLPPNTFITPNDRDIRKTLIGKGFHKMDFETMVWKLEQWIYDYVKYNYDNNLWGNMEQWTSASHVFKKRVSDCEDHAILFQTCMHILGHGDKSVVMVNVCEFGSAFKGGHAYNKVLIDNKWTVVDPTNPKKFKKDDWIYDIVHPSFNWFFNYWGTYKIKDNKVLGNE